MEPMPQSASAEPYQLGAGGMAMPSSSSSWGAMGSRPKINQQLGTPGNTARLPRLDAIAGLLDGRESPHRVVLCISSVVALVRSSSPRATVRRRLWRQTNKSSAIGKFGEEERSEKGGGARASGVGERVVYGSSHALMLWFYGLRRTLKGTYVFCDVTSAPGRPRAPPGGRPPTRSSESASPSSSIIPPSTGSRTCSTCRRCSWARPRFVSESA